MAKITTEMIQKAYDTAKRVYEGSLSRTAATREIVKATGMSNGMASTFVTDFLCMTEGRCYKWCMSFAATAYFLLHIGADYGPDAQKRAAQAVKAHVAYYRQVHAYLRRTDNLADRYLT